jgi:hypothetical protein
MVEEDLTILYEAAWAKATEAERRALRQAAELADNAAPADVFTTLAKRAQRIDPILVTYLWGELDVKRRVTRIELDEAELSEPVSQAVQMALAYELGQRIDRVLEALGAAGNDAITQDALEAKAREAGVEWQVIAYALSREAGQGETAA